MITIPIVAGMGVGLGLLFTALGTLGTHETLRRGRHTVASPFGRPGGGRSDRATIRGAVAVVAGVLMLLLTGWVVGAALVGIAAATLPRILGRAGAGGASVERIEAVAAWAEMLRDTMAAASGIEEAIASTATVAPQAIEASVQRLAARLQRERLGPALRDFAAEVDDPTVDLIVTALAMAETRPARDLGSLLGALARSARSEASMRLRIHASRGRLRTAVKVVVVTTLGFAGALVVFNGEFLAPYDDAVGQAWLLLVGMLFAAAIWQLQRMAQIAEPPRLIEPTGPQIPAAGASSW